MVQLDEEAQTMRLAGQNKTIGIVTRLDTPIGKEIVLWEDVLVDFLDAAYLQHKTKVLPFLKGSNFRPYDFFYITIGPAVFACNCKTMLLTSVTPTTTSSHQPAQTQSQGSQEQSSGVAASFQSSVETAEPNDFAQTISRAIQGDPEAQTDLGEIYRIGFKVDQDYQKGDGLADQVGSTT
ncbi:hypothetical protein BGW39_010603 [Mortierella sp. 14UC]|nr:hypothetical protein BGW39_010603 [Mortierella sp. 14UC]